MTRNGNFYLEINFNKYIQIKRFHVLQCLRFCWGLLRVMTGRTHFTRSSHSERSSQRKTRRRNQTPRILGKEPRQTIVITRTGSQSSTQGLRTLKMIVNVQILRIEKKNMWISSHQSRRDKNRRLIIVNIQPWICIYVTHIFTCV